MLKATTVNTSFNELAEIILNKSAIKIIDRIFRICEIEFYKCNEEHRDTYTHCDKDQKTKCHFYFHKYKTGTYKSGTYKCLDITNGDKKTYFGILIRSV